MNYVLKNDYYEVTFSTRGGEMISIKNRDGEELLWQSKPDSVWTDHAPLLFPFCGRLKDGHFFYKGQSYEMKIHGFALRTEFELKEKSESEITFALSSNDDTKKIYPFDFLFTVKYTLDEDKISLDVKVENTGNEVLPYIFGWHPGFRLFTDKGQDIEDYAVKFKDKKEVTRVYHTKDLMMPANLVPYPTPNSEYKLCEEDIYKHDTIILQDAGNEVTLTADGYPYALEMSWSENLPVLCIWKEAKHEAKFVCIEPWTHRTARGVGCNDVEVRPMNRLPVGKTDEYNYTLKFKF